MTATLPSAKTTFANINWQRLPEPIEHRCCESSRMRRIVARAFSTLTVMSIAASLYTAFYFNALPFTLITSAAGLAALTIALTVATLVASNMKVLPNDPEVLLKRRAHLSQKLQQNPNLGIEQMRFICPNPKAFTKEEMNLLMWQDAQTMEYAPFMKKHGRVLNILDEENLEGLRPKFIAHIVKENKTLEQILAMPESQKFGVTKEDLNAFLNDDACGPYLEFIAKYGFNTLNILNEENLAALRCFYMIYLVEVCIETKGETIAQILEMPASKIFGLKTEDFDAALAPAVKDCPNYADFVLKYGEKSVEALDAFNRAQLRLSFMQYLTDVCILKKHLSLKEILNLVDSQTFKVKKEEIGALVAMDQIQLLMAKEGTFEEFEFALIEFLPEGKGKEYIESRYLEFILNQKLGLLEFEAREEERRVFSKEVLDKVAAFTMGNEVIAFMEDKYDYWAFKTRNGPKGVQILVAEDEGRCAKALAQLMIGVFAKNLTPLLNGDYAEDCKLLGLTEKDIQKIIEAEVAKEETFESLVNHLCPLCFEKGAVNAQTPKLAGLVTKYVLAEPSLFLKEDIAANSYASIIMRYQLMPEELALYVKNYEKEMCHYKRMQAEFELVHTTKVTGLSQEKANVLVMVETEADLDKKKRELAAASNDYAAAVKAKKELENKLSAVKVTAQEIETAKAEPSGVLQKYEEVKETARKIEAEIKQLANKIAINRQVISAILGIPDSQIKEMQKEMRALQQTGEELLKAAAGYQQRLLLLKKLDQFPYKVGTPEFDQQKAELKQLYAYAESHETDSINPHQAKLHVLIAAEQEFHRLLIEIQQLPTEDVSLQVQEVQTQMKDLQQKLANAEKARTKSYQEHCITLEIPACEQQYEALKKFSAASLNDLTEANAALAKANENLELLTRKENALKPTITELESQLWSASGEESAAKDSFEQAAKESVTAEEKLDQLILSLNEKFKFFFMELKHGYNQKLAELEKSHNKTIAALKEEFMAKQFTQVG